MAGGATDEGPDYLFAAHAALETLRVVLAGPLHPGRDDLALNTLPAAGAHRPKEAEVVLPAVRLPVLLGELPQRLPARLAGEAFRMIYSIFRDTENFSINNSSAFVALPKLLLKEYLIATNWINLNFISSFIYKS